VKKLLILFALFIIASPVFPALQKDRIMDGHIYKHHVLIKALYDRTKNKVVAYYAVYKDADYYAANPHGERKIVQVVIPFSVIPVENLLNVQSITQTATKRSILVNDVETNWWNDAEVVED